MINRQDIDRIFSTADIVEVIQDFVQLKKAGTNYKGLSPFTNEKTPSFVVSPAKGIFKCFSTGIGGNAVGFLMEHEKFSYPEALRYLAKKYHIDIQETEATEEEKEKKNERESLLISTSYAQKSFTETLFQHPEGKAIGLSYFKERGFREETIQKFELGYSPNEKDFFTKKAEKAGYKLEYLVKSGLTIQKDNWKIDRFYGRVMFPIHSLAGNVIAFGARTLRSDKKTAKYLNSPESEIYHKSNVLYGIYFAKKAIVKANKCYMVEGYTDMISMFQTGIENVVASSGTALTSAQVRLVKRFSTNLTILYDGDPAGIKASLRGIDLVLEEGLNVKIVLLPEGEDPDSYSKKLSSQEFIEYIEKNERDFIRFKTELLISEAEKDPIKKATLITDIVRSIAIIPDNIVQSVYVRESSEILNIAEQVLYNELNKIRHKKLEHANKSASYSSNYNQPKSVPVPAFVSEIFSEREEKSIIYFLLNFGHQKFNQYDDDAETVEEHDASRDTSVAQYIVGEIQNDDLNFSNLIYKQIFEQYETSLNSGIVMDEKSFINHSNSEIRSLTANLLSSNYQPSEIWKKGGRIIDTPELTYKKDVVKAMFSYKLKVVQMAIKNIENEIKILAPEDSEKMEELFTKKMMLDQVKMQLAKEAGERIII